MSSASTSLQEAKIDTLHQETMRPKESSGYMNLTSDVPQAPPPPPPPPLPYFNGGSISSDQLKAKARRVP